MYCRNCGKEVAEQAVMCVVCGVPPKNGKKFCQNCGAPTDSAAEVCIKCGVRLAVGSTEGATKSKIVAGLLGIFLGGIGIHRFYLGYTGIGVAQLVLGLLGIITFGVTSIIAEIWGFIEGILILVGTINKDAKRNPLKD